MAKSITFFDKEHTGGIDLAAMEDTQLKENLVQDIAAGGDEAPTATAVKEAVDAKMDKADIINDLTTGGTDKALSAEQGKVLDGKKLDKLTEVKDLVYVHGSDGTEQGKALEDFAMKAEVTDFVELDSASMPNTLATLADVKEDGIFKKWVYVDTAELGTAKDGDIVQLTVAGKNYFGILGGPQAGTGATIDDEMLNTTLPASGNWQGWSRIYITNSIDNVAVVNGKTNTYCTFLFDGDETLDTLPTLNGPMPTGGFSYSIVFIKPSDIKANRLTTGIPSPYLPQVDGSTIKPGDILLIDTPAEAANRIRSIQCIITHTAASSNTQIGTTVHNIKLPAAGNWGGWLVGRILSTGWDREALLSKTDSTKMQFYSVSLSKTGKTFASMPNLIGFNKDKGISHSIFFVHPDDLGVVKNTLKNGDIVSFTRIEDSTGKAMGHINAVFNHIDTGTTVNDEKVINVEDPDGGNFKDWYHFFILSSAYDRVQIGNKRSQYTVTNMISDEETPETAATLVGCDVTGTSNKALSYVYVKPEELGITDYNVGANVIVNISAALAKQQITIEGWLGSKVSSGSTLIDGIMLNTKLPESGNWNGFCRLNITNILTNPAVINAKSRNWTVTVKATDTQFQDTWKASKTGAIEDRACPQINFMLTKDMMSQIPNAKVGDTIYISAGMKETKLPYNLYLYGKLHSLVGVPASQSPTYYQIQDNSGDVSGCGTMQLISGNILSGLVQRKPNFWAMTTTPENSNIPAGLRAISQIAFAPGKDTAAFADALKKGDLIEVSMPDIGILYVAQFTRFAVEADNTNGNKSLIVGQATEPTDMTGYLFCNIISSVYEIGYRNILITSRYNSSQFEVGRKYAISIKPVGTDQLYTGNTNIEESTFDLYKTVVRYNITAGTFLKLRIDNQHVLCYIDELINLNDAGTIYVICMAKGSEVASDLTRT